MTDTSRHKRRALKTSVHERVNCERMRICQSTLHVTAGMLNAVVFYILLLSGIDDVKLQT